ncbi:hypothetical protein DFR58_116116 [Anaerobacterium chartisolvens]|uniref:Uncharacterized protein n=1 Tax=Anaerobacterium chartisolvens TaxID=1297424 RepID=A0A369AWV5_9FIRM|nr:hypothetical protein [Anaerobacterium chartisolvens]RCX13880.1 hypothetical protein DFR58_116116 [Anaerobacterium chartisolvens]
MRWDEVRELYPNQFVKFEIVESHVIEDKEYVDEVALIKAVSDDREAIKEFISCGEGQFVYSTNNPDLVIELVKHVGIRRSL